MIEQKQQSILQLCSPCPLMIEQIQQPKLGPRWLKMSPKQTGEAQQTKIDSMFDVEKLLSMADALYI